MRKPSVNLVSFIVVFAICFYFRLPVWPDGLLLALVSWAICLPIHRRTTRNH